MLPSLNCANHLCHVRALKKYKYRWPIEVDNAAIIQNLMHYSFAEKLQTKLTEYCQTGIKQTTFKFRLEI